MDFKIRQVAEKYDLSRADQKAEFVSEAEVLIAALPSQAERQVYSSHIAEMIGVRPEAVVSDVESRRRKLVRRSETKEMRDMISRTVNMRRYDNPASARAEEGIVRLLFLDPDLYKTARMPSPDEFSDERLKKYFIVIAGKLAEGETVNVASLGADLNSEEMSMLIGILEEPEILANSKKTFEDYVSSLRKAVKKKSIGDIIKEKQELEKGRK